MYAFRSLIFSPVARHLSVMASLSAALMLLRNVVSFLEIRGEILPRMKLNWSVKDHLGSIAIGGVEASRIKIVLD